MQHAFRSFDQVATDYDKTRVIPETQLNAVAKICAQTSNLNKGGSFLDAGVGTGRFAVPISKLAPGRVYGIDISLQMMGLIAEKDPNGLLNLLSGDLRRLPFKDRAFRGVLAVHILHIIKDWKLVLDELWRVIEPGGVLILGTELGGRSVLTDYYFERARLRKVLVENIGATGSSPALNYLRQRSNSHRPAASVELLSTPSLNWKRTMPIQETLNVLERSTFTQMWDIPTKDHKELIQDTQNFAIKTFGDLEADEVLKAQFTMHAIRWPVQR
jgi:ubiquinone/menaquinone biosynthesis C-methylase UbiE